jgi:fructokinase
MNNPRVLCLGEVLFDCLADQLGRSLETVESWTPYPGGAPANVASALVKLGTTAGFIGCVGGDTAGDSLVQLLQNIGVNITGLQRHPTAPTRQIYVLRSSTGERDFAGFGEFKTTDFADTFLQASSLPSQLFQDADFLVLGTLELAYPDTRNAIHKALNLANKYNVKIVVDVNLRPVFWPNIDEAKPLILDLLKHIDFLKLSQEEAEWLFDTTDAGAINYRLSSVEGVLVTAGDQGCAYCLGEQEGKIPAFPVKVVDTTGAGDGFLAGFIHQLCLQGISCLKNPKIASQVINYASAVGALTTTKAGAIASQPTDSEVQAFLNITGS